MSADGRDARLRILTDLDAAGFAATREVRRSGVTAEHAARQQGWMEACALLLARHRDMAATPEELEAAVDLVAQSWLARCATGQAAMSTEIAAHEMAAPPEVAAPLEVPAAPPDSMDTGAADDGPTITQDDVDRLRDEVAGLETRRDELHRSLGVQQDALEEQRRAHDRLVGDVESLRAAHVRLAADVEEKAAEDLRLSATLAAATRELARVESTREQLSDSVAELAAEEARLQERTSQLEELPPADEPLPADELPPPDEPPPAEELPPADGPPPAGDAPPATPPVPPTETDPVGQLRRDEGPRGDQAAASTEEPAPQAAPVPAVPDDSATARAAWLALVRPYRRDGHRTTAAALAAMPPQERDRAEELAATAGIWVVAPRPARERVATDA